MNSESGEGVELTLALAGDARIARPLSMFDDERFLSVVKVIRDADAAFFNLEALLLDARYGPFYDSGGEPPHGRYVALEPWGADELKWMGYGMCSCAMTHAWDFLYNGILSTIRVLDEKGIVHAGSGRTLSEARFPGYLQTKKGYIALISALGDVPPMTPALDPAGCNLGKPGINPLRTDVIIDSETAKKLQEVFVKVRGKVTKVEAWGHDVFEIGSTRYIIGKKKGHYCYPKARETDLDANMREVRGAAKQADWVLFAYHYHDMYNDAAAEVAHSAIDNGADVFIGHGSGARNLGGIEIYKNKPIFYNIGVFIAQLETLKFQSSGIYENMNIKDGTLGDIPDEYPTWWSCLFVPTLRGKQGPERKLVGLRLYPIDQRPTPTPRGQRGRPLMAKRKLAREIIEGIRKASAQFNTSIEFRDGIGVAKL